MSIEKGISVKVEVLDHTMVTVSKKNVFDSIISLLNVLKFDIGEHVITSIIVDMLNSSDLYRNSIINGKYGSYTFDNCTVTIG